MAKKNIFVNLDLQQNELQNPVIHNLPAAPGSPLAGQEYFDTVTNILYYYNGTMWVAGTGVQSVTAGSLKITVDNTDPENPIIDADVAEFIDDSVSTSTNIYSAQKVDFQIAAAVSGAEFKDAVQVASNGSIANLSNIDVTDFDSTAQGITLIAGNRVLVQNPSSLDGIESLTAAREGIYVVGIVTGGFAALTRSTDADTSAKVKNGMTIANVEQGFFTGYRFTLTTADPIILDTTLLSFAAIPNAGYLAGAALSLSGTTFNVQVDNSSIDIASNQLEVKALGVTNAMLAGSIADSKLNTITTANKVSGSAVQLGTNAGLSDSTGLIVNVDNSTIEKNAGTLRVKDLGITTAKLANASITPAKLANKYAADFLNTDFVSGVLTITAATHGLGASQDLYVFVRDSSQNDVSDGVVENIAANGDVTITVNVGFEFSGRIIIVA